MSALVAENPREAHQSLVDAQTPVHVALGVTAGVLGITVTATVLWSIAAQISLRALDEGMHRAVFEKVRPAESLGNHAVDVLGTVLGYAIGTRLRARYGAPPAP